MEEGREYDRVRKDEDEGAHKRGKKINMSESQQEERRERKYEIGSRDFNMCYLDCPAVFLCCHDIHMQTSTGRERGCVCERERERWE